MNHKHFYGASSYMGLSFIYDSPCWSLYAFDSKKERDEWVNGGYDGRQYTRESVSLKSARKISPWLHDHNPHDDQNGYYSYNQYRDVNHA